MFRLWHRTNLHENKMCYQLVLIVLALIGVKAEG